MNNGSRHVGFDSLKCPQCGATIPVSAAIAAHVAEEARFALQTERQALEDRIKAVNLEVGRRIDAERQKIEATVARRIKTNTNSALLIRKRHSKTPGKSTRNSPGNSSKARNKAKGRSSNERLR